MAMAAVLLQEQLRFAVHLGRWLHFAPTVDLLPFFTDAWIVAAKSVDASKAHVFTLGHGLNHKGTPCCSWVHAVHFPGTFFPVGHNCLRASQTSIALLICACILDILTLIITSLWNVSWLAIFTDL